MKQLAALLLIAATMPGCDKPKDKQGNNGPCDYQTAYKDNETKVSVIKGVWGTIVFEEGNCMPIIDPATTNCKTCPVSRKVQIYEYTTRSQAVPVAGSSVFYESFNTRLVKEAIADKDGFFQANLPAGQYSIVIKEDGKLYANSFDGHGGIAPFIVASGSVKYNVRINYKAYY